MEKLRAFLYCRTVHDDGISLSLQSKRLTKHVQELGYANIGIATDVASGQTLDRIELLRMVRAIRTGAVDVVLTIDLSRIAQDSLLLHRFVHLINEQDVKLISVKDRIVIDRLHPYPPLQYAYKKEVLLQESQFL